MLLQLKKINGNSNEFLKADGSIDNNTYVTTTTLSSYLPFTGGILTGLLTIKKSSYNVLALERTDSANGILIVLKIQMEYWDG